MITPEYTWRQTSKSVVVEVPLKGSAAKSVNILATEVLVKLSFERYLLHLDLLHPIDDTTAVAKIKQGVLNLKLTKQSPGTWESLLLENATKEELQQRRASAIEAKEERDKALDSRVQQRKHEDERKALKKQMALEEDERQHIDDLKAEEKREAEEQVYKTFAELEQNKQQQRQQQQRQKKKAAGAAKPPPAPSAAEVGGAAGVHGAEEDQELDAAMDAALDAMLAEDDDDVVAAERKREEEQEEDLGLMAGDSWEMIDQMSSQDPRDEGEQGPLPGDDDDLDVNHLPEVRDGGVVKFHFTPRIFPTPSRESKAAEEEDWIAQNRSHLRKNPMLKPQLDAMDIEDSDPTWLKGKGDDFYRARDYRAAVNAYTTALELDDSLLPVLSNLGACYLQLGELVRCVGAMDQLLDTLQREAMGMDANPNDEVKKKLSIKAFARRGTARCQQGKFEEALLDYKQAVILSQGEEASLVADYRRVESLSKCNRLKKDADQAFGNNDLRAAVSLYNDALGLEPAFVSAISNRAACHLALGDLDACIADCTDALTLLEINPQTASSATASLGSAKGPVGSLPQHQQEKFNEKLLGRIGVGASGMIPSGPLPPPGTSKRRTWVLKTIARRGTAWAQKGDYSLAAEDYRVACTLDGDNENLKRDLELFETKVKTSQESQCEVDPAAPGGDQGK